MTKEARTQQIKFIVSQIQTLSDCIQGIMDEELEEYDICKESDEGYAIAVLVSNLLDVQITLLQAHEQMETVETPEPDHTGSHLKKFMVMTYLEGEQSTFFYDSLDAAEQHRMDAECGLGAYAEVYQRNKHDTAYELLYA